MLTELLSQGLIGNTITWLVKNYIEIAATLTGFLYLYYSIKENILLWLFGIISSGIYVYVTLVGKIYADMCIYIYYVLIGIYGWVHWSVKDTKQEQKVLIVKTSIREALILGVITLLTFFLIAYILTNFTDSTVPFWDALTTSGAITATWMLTRKRLEHWLMWIVINFFSIGLYYYKGLIPTSVLYAVYAVFSVVGYIQWNKKWKLQSQNSSL